MKWTRKKLDRLYLIILFGALVSMIGTWAVYLAQGVEAYQIAKLNGGIGITAILGLILMELRVGRSFDATDYF